MGYVYARRNTNLDLRDQGSDLYLGWIVGSNITHDLFFTNPKVIASYRKLHLIAPYILLTNIPNTQNHT